MQGFKLNSMLFGTGSGAGQLQAFVDCDPRRQDDDTDDLMSHEQLEMMMSALPPAYQRPHLKVLSC